MPPLEPGQQSPIRCRFDGSFHLVLATWDAWCLWYELECELCGHYVEHEPETVMW